MADGPPSQSSIDALNTTTPNLAALADMVQCIYMHGRWNPWSIEHTCLEYCYTKSVSHIGQCTYKLKADGPLSIEHTRLEYDYTRVSNPENFYIRKTFYP